MGSAGSTHLADLWPTGLKLAINFESPPPRRRYHGRSGSWRGRKLRAGCIILGQPYCVVAPDSGILMPAEALLRRCLLGAKLLRNRNNYLFLSKERPSLESRSVAC